LENYEPKVYDVGYEWEDSDEHDSTLRRSCTREIECMIRVCECREEEDIEGREQRVRCKRIV